MADNFFSGLASGLASGISRSGRKDMIPQPTGVVSSIGEGLAKSFLPYTPADQPITDRPPEDVLKASADQPITDRPPEDVLKASHEVNLSGLPKIDAIKTMIADQVKALGTEIPVSYFDKMAKIESGYNPKAGSPTGAKGLFQFIGDTWRAYGSGDPFDPVANTRAAIKLAQDNFSSLAKTLQRTPSEAELYIAHNIGASGAKRLLTADPNMSVTTALIGTKPAYNPKFLTDGKGGTITARQAILNYRKAFSEMV